MGKKSMSSNHDNQTEKTTDLESASKAEAVNLWKTEYLHEIDALKVELHEVKSCQELYVANMEV